MFSDWWGCDGITIGPSNSQHIYGRTWNYIIPKVNNFVKRWRRFVDDTFVYIKRDSIGYVLFVLNSFHDNITFTYEQENNDRLPFLNVLFIRDHEKINTTVFRKDIHNHLYSHWDSFSSIYWKRGTLKWLISRKGTGTFKKTRFIKTMVTLCRWLINLRKQ